MSFRRELWTWVLLAATSLLALAANGGVSNATVTVAEYRAELQRIEAAVQAITTAKQVGPLEASIPKEYQVSTKIGLLTVDNAALKKAVGRLFIEKNRAASRARLAQELERAAAETIEFEKPSAVDDSHTKLAAILAASEFSEVRGPTLLEIWRDKLVETFSRWWYRMMQKIPTPSGGHQEVTWILIAIAACVLAIVLKRMYERRDPETPKEIIPFAPSGKHWRSWLAEARAAAAAGNWRDAVHLGYWAAISHLESSGAWSPDNARTPREYVRLIGTDNAGRGELVALTRDFERIWYGSQAAGHDEFDQTVAHLERLGCR